MMRLAAENNLSETAYIVKEPQSYHLRWFTPGTEVEICGHATLASAFVILNFIDTQADKVEFDTLSGKLTVNRVGDMLELVFPTYKLEQILTVFQASKRSGYLYCEIKDNGRIAIRGNATLISTVELQVKSW